MKPSLSKNRLSNRIGFTLIEVVVVVIIAGVLATVALRSGLTVYTSAKTEETKQELDQLAIAISGNEQLQSNGVRTDFGYVGDVGSMPANLDALLINPGGYSTWNGPYLSNSFVQESNDFKEDAWGTTYTYSGGVDIISTGSGSEIVRKITESTNDLIGNSVSGNLFDLDGTPPGLVYKDSVSVVLTIPDGTGGMSVRSISPEAGGYFSFANVPVGNHTLELIYQPDADTLRRFVSVTPKSELYGEYRLSGNVWFDPASPSGSGLIGVAGSDSVYSFPQCANVSALVFNSGSSPITVSSLAVTYSMTAYYRQVWWNGVQVFSSNNPRNGSGDVALFSSSQTINAGDTARIMLTSFTSSYNGGATLSIENSDLTLNFPDGSSIDFTAGGCL